MSQVTTGFCNWRKDATVTFSKHLQSKQLKPLLHFQKKQRMLVCSLISHTKQRRRRQGTCQSSVRFLARQGLALRGDGSDVSSNLTQLLNVRAEDNPQILPWITKKVCKHMHPDNQNEMLVKELMVHQVLKRILDDADTSPFLAVMVDETRDQSNKEQLTLVLRWVSDDFTVCRAILPVSDRCSEHCGCHKRCLFAVPDTFHKTSWSAL